MLGKVKQWLGIEGVKLELYLPDAIPANKTKVAGTIRLTSMNDQVVKRIQIAMIERYVRGRGDEQLVDEYQLGFLEIDEEIRVVAGATVEYPFVLEYEVARSEIDEFGARNFLNRLIAAGARRLNQVSSVYRVEAEAQVKGVALNPFDKKIITVTGI
jgi:hypothetical protein